MLQTGAGVLRMKWIYIKDTFPPPSMYVLLHLYTGAIVAGIYELDETQYFTTMDYHVYQKDVTHWMELPERPA
jgi:hypothetical protein